MSPGRFGRRRRRSKLEKRKKLTEVIMTYAKILIKKGKRGAAAFVQAECMSNKGAANGGR